jgi:hypothetical protein
MYFRDQRERKGSSAKAAMDVERCVGITAV